MNESQLTHEQKEFMRERDRSFLASLSHTDRALHEKTVRAIEVGRMQEGVDAFKARPYHYIPQKRSWAKASLLSWRQGTNTRTVLFEDVPERGRQGELVVIVHDPGLKLLIQHGEQEVHLLDGSGEIDWNTAIPALRDRALEAGQTWVIALPGGPRLRAARSRMELRACVKPQVGRGADRVFVVRPFLGSLTSLKTPEGAE
jgi:hypothetical protein